MGRTFDKTRDHMHTGSEIPKDDSETDKEVGHGSCNKRPQPQPQLKMFS